MKPKLLLTLYLCILKWLGSINGGQCFHTYDFIIVGSGAGGGVVARRLVETGKFKVLLVESGGNPKPDYDVPAFAMRFLRDSDVTFQMQSVPQNTSVLQNNGVVAIVAGRMLGGTTSLNFMWHNRGHARDWDNWADVTGDESWKYENMLKYFKRSETYEGDFPSDQHGHDGPITVSRPQYAPGLDYWLEAGRELGYQVSDPNGPQERSFSPIEFSKKKGRRVGSLVGYLAPVMDNPNLHILMNTKATQILFRGSRAIGVRYIPSENSTDSRYSSIAFATKEVILSAGAYNSPLILQRSGIGPRDLLQTANIPVIRYLPVGLNYQDHAAVRLLFTINNASAVMDEERDLTEENWNYFNTDGYGPYSTTRSVTGQAFLSSSIAQEEANSDWPDVQLAMSHCKITNASANMLLNPVLNKGEVTMSTIIILGRPKSTGSISINPENVFGGPIWDVGYLRDARDVQSLVDGIMETILVFEETDSYKRLQARYEPVKVPACVEFPLKSQEYWECYVKQTVAGGTHPAGTNKMGRRNDTSSVVDSELRVIGVEGLRVVDASIMPFIVNANPQAPVYAISEKASDLILAKWA